MGTYDQRNTRPRPFTCPRCGWHAAVKARIVQHLRKAKACAPLLTDEPRDKLLREYRGSFAHEYKRDPAVTCPTCGKAFVTRGSMMRVHVPRCAIKAACLPDEYTRQKGRVVPPDEPFRGLDVFDFGFEHTCNVELESESGRERDARALAWFDARYCTEPQSMCVCMSARARDVALAHVGGGAWREVPIEALPCARGMAAEAREQLARLLASNAVLVESMYGARPAAHVAAARVT